MGRKIIYSTRLSSFRESYRARYLRSSDMTSMSKRSPSIESDLLKAQCLWAIVIKASKHAPIPGSTVRQDEVCAKSRTRSRDLQHLLEGYFQYQSSTEKLNFTFGHFVYVSDINREEILRDCERMLTSRRKPNMPANHYLAGTIICFRPDSH
jgi:hypothetical protein